MKKFILLHLYIFTAFIGGFLLASDVIAQSSADCLRQYHERQGSCSAAAKACIDGCPGAQGVDLGPLSECLRSCSKQEDSCNETADAAYDTCIASPRSGQQTPEASPVETPELEQQPAPTSEEIPEETLKPQAGVSSKDFRALVQAMNEFQSAQAVLEKLKEASDRRWEAKKDFANEYNMAFDPASIQIAGRLQADKVDIEKTLKVLRTDLEQVKDLAGVYQDIDDFSGYLRGKGFEASSRAGKVAEVGEGIITFLDLTNQGVSVENAVTKATIDTVAPSMFYVFPPLKAADLVATLPDDIMGAIGIPEGHWSRIPTGFLAANSPSAFVEITTDAMVKTNTWTNAAGAFQVAWDDLKTAEGFWGKAKATLDLVGTAVGAIPVAIAMHTRDQVSTVIDVFKLGVSNAGNFISSVFTWPD